MPLNLESRHCGKVYIIRCAGRIVTGAEVGELESAIHFALREFTRIVLELSQVDRIDSTGMGLLVRFLTSVRNRGGDLRLAAPTSFLVTLLEMTRLTSILRIYPSEDDAILSFYSEAAPVSQDPAASSKRVLFLDQSADLCAFVRHLLGSHGYDVHSTMLVRDAKVLLRASQVDVIVLGPGSEHLPSETVASSLKTVAPLAAMLQLEADFRHGDPHEAGRTLLNLIQSRGNS